MQDIVDGVGKELRRAVLIEDARFRHLAHSSHYGNVDSVRTESILHRVAPVEATDWALTFGIAEAADPVRLPPNPDLHMDARACVPVRHDGSLLGYLWLIDSDQSLTNEQLAVARNAADSAGAILYRERLLSELARGRERELLRDLLSEDSALRRHAADELIDREMFATDAPVAAVVVRVGKLEDGGDSLAATGRDSVRAALTSAVDHVRRPTSARRMIALARPDHAVVVCSLGDPSWSSEGLPGLAERLRSFTQSSLESGWPVVAGIGDPRKDMVDVAGSYSEALQAASVAQIVSSLGPVAAWSELGIYQLLSTFPLERLGPDALHPGLARLARRRGGNRLVETLERYLDSGCDARATAQNLVVHRASLYSRLRRIEDIAGIDLRNGEDRLAMHLSLKLARLAAVQLPDQG